ncbi:uncharacterized protein LOC122262047 [Penaeus japonicus]|uniref:uncharacterized protein LOC122262047 n=1 Tax=Penaeus japonicus TaxID=27405 RepID=UPI001C7177C7|nr:uncharacterized protein LOC122262047 [Penaeus japonicus]
MFFKRRKEIQARPQVYLWAAVAVLVGVRAEAWASPAIPCTRCNSTVTVGEDELPKIGFICPEGFPGQRIRFPYTCLVFFNLSSFHNLTIHVQEFYTRDMSVVLCTKDFYDHRHLLRHNDQLRKNHCRSVQPEENARWLGFRDAMYINITKLPSEEHSEPLFLHGISELEVSGEYSFSYILLNKISS